MTNPKDTSQDLVNFLSNDPDETIGYATGMNADGTVNVRDERGNTINAIAATPIVSQPTLCERVNGTWYAFQSPNQVTSERTLIHRRSSPTPSQEAGPIKVLFYIQKDDGYDWYIGGDRPKPTKIYSTIDLPEATYLSSLGRGVNKWVVGMKESIRVLNIYPNNKVFVCSHPAAPYLEWKGCGFWAYSFAAEAVTYFKINVQRQETRDGNYVNWTDSWQMTPAYPAPLVNGSGSGSGSGRFYIDPLS